MADLPTGTVTFLCTDMAASLRLQQFGQHVACLLVGSRHALRTLLAAPDGPPVATQRSACVVLPRARAVPTAHGAIPRPFAPHRGSTASPVAGPWDGLQVGSRGATTVLGASLSRGPQPACHRAGAVPTSLPGSHAIVVQRRHT